MQLTERERIELMRVGGALVGVAMVVRLLVACPLLTGLVVFLLF